MAVLVPKNPAAGKPWVLRADRIDRSTSEVDLGLLAKGYYIVAPPLLAAELVLHHERPHQIFVENSQLFGCTWWSNPVAPTTGAAARNSNRIASFVAGLPSKLRSSARA